MAKSVRFNCRVSRLFQNLLVNAQQLPDRVRSILEMSHLIIDQNKSRVFGSHGLVRVGLISHDILLGLWLLNSAVRRKDVKAPAQATT
jgi:hypothetical protein